MKKLLIFALAAGAMLVSSCSSKQPSSIVQGDASQFDTLSYALGVNIGDYFLKSQMTDLPLNVEVMAEGFEKAALGNSKMSSEEAIGVLDGYFRDTRMVRQEIVARKRAVADSMKRVNGVSESTIIAERALVTADADMFESEEQRDEVSLALGVDLGLNLRKEDLPLHTYWVKSALIDLSNDKATLDNTEAMNFIQNYYMVEVPKKNQEISEEKLAEIETKSGVVKTESGLMYRVKSKGDEKLRPVSPNDRVKVNYTGRLLRNNTVFDTSRYSDRSDEQKAMMKQANQPKEDAPVEFQLSQVIKGWTEGMMFVGQGGRIELWIPADLAYGSNGAGNMIRPNDAIYFDVELLEVTLSEPANE